MAVQIVRDLKRQKGTHAQRQGSEHFIADVEIVVRVAAALASKDAVVGILNWVSRYRGPEGGAHLHALQNEVNTETILALHRLEVAANVILFAHALLRPLDWDPLLAGESIHPTVVVAGALPQNILGDHAGLMDIAKEMNDVLRARQKGQVPQNDDAVKTVIYQSQQAAKQLGEGLHRSSSIVLPRQQDHRRTGGAKARPRAAVPRKGRKGSRERN